MWHWHYFCSSRKERIILNVVPLNICLLPLIWLCIRCGQLIVYYLTSESDFISYLMRTEMRIQLGCLRRMPVWGQAQFFNASPSMNRYCQTSSFLIPLRLFHFLGILLPFLITWGAFFTFLVQRWYQRRMG